MRQTSGVEGNIQVTGVVNQPQNFTYSQIKALTPITVQVNTKSDRPSENGTFKYTGIQLKTLLELAQISPTATSIYIQAPDGFGITLSLQEAQKPNILLAYQKDGAPLTSFSSGGEGPLRLVIGDDKFLSRWVKDVTLIQVQ